MGVIKQALISVSDKTGVVEFARALHKLGANVISTGGTAQALKAADVPVVEVSDYTGFPEMLDGRVKTLHPKVHAGILVRRDVQAHVSALETAGIAPIDLVVVNLYPFTKTIARECTLEEAVEMIDIGGPAMVRSAAKNYQHVGVVTDPSDYPALLKELAASGGALGSETRFNLARKAFAHTAAYDGAIGNYMTSIDVENGQRERFPGRLSLQFELAQPLRYGENPHQEAAFYRDAEPPPGALARYVQLQGKDLSYNNIADADAAWECVKTFEGAACVIVKHANPCGVALGGTLSQAYRNAFATDPTSAFGGIIAFNGEIDESAAAAVCEHFVEVIIAPGMTSAAAAVFAQKPNVRVLQVPLGDTPNALDLKRVGGGVLVQTPDDRNVAASELKVVTRVAPSPAQLGDLLFAWRVAKFVKSNAIVFCGAGRTLGVGAGQMSRVDSARIASMKAANASLDLKGSVVASDAFFPFRDGVDAVAESGARAIIQPGGSMRDDEVIGAANERGLAMVFTGVRHFRH